jgi:hypothetical protein
LSARTVVHAALIALLVTVANARPRSACAADPDTPAVTASGLEALNPELAAHPYRLDPGPRPFQNRMSVSPSYGYLGAEPLYSLRVAYNPEPWLGYEGSLAHNPGQSVHAVLHTLSAIVRKPLPGRYQPYATAGYGMVMVFPGHSLNAAPVTKNTLSIGGGMEFYIRTDLALRAEVRNATVLGRQLNRDGVVAFDYLQETIGFAFYRTIQP